MNNDNRYWNESSSPDDVGTFRLEHDRILVASVARNYNPLYNYYIVNRWSVNNCEGGSFYDWTDDVCNKCNWVDSN